MKRPLMLALYALAVLAAAVLWTPAESMPLALGVVAVSGIAPLNGWRQIGVPGWLALCQHTFDVTPDRQLAHYTDGTLRAIVPPEGWEGYMRQWPEAADVIRQLLTRPEPVTASPVTPADGSTVEAGVAGVVQGDGNSVQNGPGVAL